MAGEGDEDDPVEGDGTGAKAGLRVGLTMAAATRTWSFCPAWQWPGKPQRKYKWPGFVRATVSEPEV